MKIRLFIGKKYNPFQLKLPNKVFKKIISILIKLDIQCHFAMVFKNYIRWYLKINIRWYLKINIRLLS